MSLLYFPNIGPPSPTSSTQPCEQPGDTMCYVVFGTARAAVKLGKKLHLKLRQKESTPNRAYSSSSSAALPSSQGVEDAEDIGECRPAHRVRLRHVGR